MRLLRRIAAAVAVVCALTPAMAQGLLPLTVDEDTFYDNNIFISKDNVSADGAEIRTGDGWGAFTIALDGVPGRLTLQYTRNSYGQNREMGFQESPDNSAWTDILVTDPPTSWTDLSSLLKPETRYIRFRYSADYKFGDFWTKIGYVRNIYVGKAIAASTGSLSFETEAGTTQTKEFDLAVTNLKGDLHLSCSDPDFTVTPSTVTRDEALGAGTVRVSVTYRPTSAVSAEARLTIADTGYADNSETVALDGRIIPSTPVAAGATDVTSTSFVANWEAPLDFEYLLTVTQDSEVLPGYSDLVCRGSSRLVDGLQPGMTYSYSVKARNSDMVSAASEAVAVTLHVPSVEAGSFGTFSTTAGSAVSQTTEVTAEYLAGDVTLSLKHGGEFSLSDEVIPAGETSPIMLEVTYSPLAIGESRDTLVMESPYLSPLIIPLYGINSLPAPEVLEASDVTNSGFTAHWTAVDGATDYRLTVETADGVPVPSYNGLATGDVTSYAVTNLVPATDYVYYVRSVAGGVVSDGQSDMMSVTTADGAVITYSHTPKDFVVVNGSSVSQTLRISGTNVFGGITAGISGSEAFSIDVSSLPVGGGLVTVTFTPDGFGTYDAALSLSASGAETVTIDLRGLSTPARPTGLTASQVGTSSFTAGWQKVDGAEGYVMTLRRGSVTVPGYEALALGDVAEYTVDGLAEATSYNYSVRAVAAGVEGEAYDYIQARTLFTPVVEAVAIAGTSAIVRWNEPYKADSYLLTLKQGGSPVSGYDRMPVTSAVRTVEGLAPSTTYTCTVAAVFGGTEIESQEMSFTTPAASHAQGNQLNNSGFEEWEGSGDTHEPVDWNSFGTMTGSMSSMASMAGIRMEESSDVRPGTTGSKSVRIWTGSVFGVNANGNLTTGRINAGSMSPADAANHNFTVTDDEAFSERIDARPDSLTVWVKYTAADASSLARVAAIIHDNYSYRDPSGSDPNADSHVVGTAEMNYSSDGGVWQRLSIPFNYRDNGLSPDFMLVTFSSNMTPGGGSANDAVIVDDLHLVYKPSLTVGTLQRTSYSPGDVIALDYELSGSMSVPNINADANVVRLEISDKAGSFASPRVIASMVTDGSGTIAGALPDDLEAGSLYKARVVTTNYPMRSEAAGTFTVTSVGTPRITASIDPTFEANIGSVPATRQLNVAGENLGSEIFLSLASDVFDLSADILPATGGTVTVTYSPNVEGEDAARLVIRSAGAEDIIVELRGVAAAPTSLSDIIADDDALTVYPSPVIDVARLMGVDGGERYSVYSIDGRMVLSGYLTDASFDASALPGGTYVITVGGKQAKFVK